VKTVELFTDHQVSKAANGQEDQEDYERQHQAANDFIPIHMAFP